MLEVAMHCARHATSSRSTQGNLSTNQWMAIHSEIDPQVTIKEQSCGILSCLIDTKHDSESRIIGIRQNALEEIGMSEDVGKGLDRTFILLIKSSSASMRPTTHRVTRADVKKEGMRKDTTRKMRDKRCAKW